jgi:hypothetical protein
MGKNNKAILLLLLLFLLLRIAIAIIAGEQNVDHGDARSYNGYAIAILQKADWITNPDFYGDFRAPVYPMFIALVYAIFGVNNFLAVYIFQSIISVLTCVYIYKLSKKFFDDKIAILSMIWAGCYIWYLQYVRLLMRETVIYFLLLVFFYYLYLYLIDGERISTNFWLSLVSYFLLTHTDPRYLFYLPFLMILFVVYQPFKRGMLNYAMFITLTILLWVPWTIRNYIAYGDIVLVNTRTLDLRDSREKNPTMDNLLKANVLNFGDIDWTSNEDYPTEEERKLVKQGLNPNERTSQEINAIKNDVYPSTTFLQRKWFQFKEFWRPFRFNYAYRPFPDCRFVYWSTKHNLVNIFSYGLLLPFMVFGIVHLFLKKNKFVWFLIFPLFTQALLHTIQWAKTRYRTPIDAFVIIIACYGLVQIYTFLEKKKYNMP